MKGATTSTLLEEQSAINVEQEKIHHLKLSSKEALRLERILLQKVRDYSVLKIGSAASAAILTGQDE